jgi:hypothetical protein
MKSLEIEKKLLEVAEKKKKQYFKIFQDFGEQHYLDLAREQSDIAESIKIRINRAERAKAKPKKERKDRPSLDRAIKNSIIEMTAYEVGIEKCLICAGTSPITATAIIDEIIESEFNAEAKLLMIKMFLDNQMSSLDIDGLLHDEMIIIPRKRAE